MAAILKTECGFRAMRDPDLAKVMQIEQQNYEFPWSQGIFKDCIRAGYQCVIGESGTELIAYGIMSVAAGECHLLNISVAPDWQGYGFGRRLVMHLLDLAVEKDAQLAILEVRPSNTVARNLYYSLGFEQVAVRKNYYPGQNGRENALVLACPIC